MLEQLALRKNLIGAGLFFAGATICGVGGIFAAVERPAGIPTLVDCDNRFPSSSQAAICDPVRERLREQHNDDQLGLQCMAACGALAVGGVLLQAEYKKTRQFLDVSGMESEYMALTGHSGQTEA